MIWIRNWFWMFAAALLTGLALTGCGAPSGGQGELAALNPLGSPVLPATRGRGDQDLGTFTANGHLSVQATCVGSGFVEVILKGIDRGFRAACVPVRSGVGGSQYGGDAFAIPAHTSFHLLVQSKPDTDWMVAVSQSD